MLYLLGFANVENTQISEDPKSQPVGQIDRFENLYKGAEIPEIPTSHFYVLRMFLGMSSGHYSKTNKLLKK